MLNLKIVTPNQIFLDGQTDSVVLPGVEGELGILPQHISLLTNLTSGILKFKENNQQKKIFVYTGIAEVFDDTVTVLTKDAAYQDDLNLKEIQEKIKDIEMQVETLSADEEKNKIQLGNLKYDLNKYKSQEKLLKLH